MQQSNIFLGMDLHKNSSNFCAMTEKGDILREVKIPTDPSEVTKFVHSLGKGSNIHIALEPVSQGSFYADLLESLGLRVHLVHPKKVKAIASARIKTDAIDARVLAHLLRSNLLPESYHAPMVIRMLKEQVRSRMSLVGIRTQLKNKVHALLWKNGLNYPKTSLFTKKGITWLKTLRLEGSFAISLTSYLSLIDSINSEIKDMEKKIEEAFESSEDMKLLKTIPGIGNITAITILSEIGDIHRFKSPKNLQSYAGLVPSTHASGDHVVNGRITKEGSRYLRYIMIETAHHQLRLSREKVGLKWYYQRLALRKNNKTAAVATARKLLTIVWKVLKERRPFEERLPKTIAILSPN